MDVEAIQLLNLSPIPELSEIELSAMLEQLSSFSDLNADFTDRNVEDILKEAEELIDKSPCGIISEPKITQYSVDVHENFEGRNDSSTPEPKEDFENMKVNENTSMFSSSFIKPAEPNKHHNSPVEITASIHTKHSPREVPDSANCVNHIKSTIDSLKEYSDLIEKKSSLSQSSSSTYNSSSDFHKKTLTPEFSEENHEKLSISGFSIEKPEVSHNNVLKSNRKNKVPKITESKTQSQPLSLDKSLKILNCFERLYQGRPARLSKPKSLEKVSKAVVKKSPMKGLKNSISCSSINEKNSKQGNTTQCSESNTEKLEKVGSSPNWNCTDNTKYLGQIELKEWWNKKDFTSQGISNQVLVENLTNTTEDLKESKVNQEPKHLGTNFNTPDILGSEQKFQKEILLKLLEELEEIKSQLKQAEIGSPKRFVDDNSCKDKGFLNESRAAMRALQSEMDLVKENFVSASVQNNNIKRLQEQFSMLKNKYYVQMEKLEEENARLREALKSTQLQINLNDERNDCPLLTEHEKVSEKYSALDSKVSKTVSQESLNQSKLNSPTSDSFGRSTLLSKSVKEAFSQTEKESKSVSIQCVNSASSDVSKSQSNADESEKKDSEEKKTVNKENILQKKKPFKSKPFSDLNPCQLLKQKKVASEHEMQLMATLRGLQSEALSKDRENRKLKNEIDLLKSQIRRLGKIKVDIGPKKYHSTTTGTQTLGLGPVVQQPYNPEIYEVPEEYEKENEDLRGRIKALEDSFDLLKEKRIKDLQSLHQIHEEEMEKLLSKLETQSALTKHLHSLLMKRQ